MKTFFFKQQLSALKILHARTRAPSIGGGGEKLIQLYTPPPHGLRAVIDSLFSSLLHICTSSTRQTQLARLDFGYTHQVLQKFGYTQSNVGSAYFYKSTKFFKFVCILS